MADTFREQELPVQNFTYYFEANFKCFAWKVSVSTGYNNLK